MEYLKNKLKNFCLEINLNITDANQYRKSLKEELEKGSHVQDVKNLLILNHVRIVVDVRVAMLI